MLSCRPSPFDLVALLNELALQAGDVETQTLLGPKLFDVSTTTAPETGAVEWSTPSGLHKCLLEAA